MDCTHEINFLVGDKDGILCRKCGQRFKDFSEIHPAPAADEKPKKGKKVKDENRTGES